MCRFALIEHSCFKPYPLAGVFCLLDIFVITPLISFKSYPLAGVFGIPTPSVHSLCRFKSYPLAGVFPPWMSLSAPPMQVSSHTPLRGYSTEIPPLSLELSVSSHTPLRGYSRAHPVKENYKIHVSSHTPLRGYSIRTGGYCARYWFQVIPPCGGIRNGIIPPFSLSSSFKSYPLAGVFYSGR